MDSTEAVEMEKNVVVEPGGWRRWYAAAGVPTVIAAPRVEVRIPGFGRIHRRWLRGGQRAAGDRCAGR
jgi:hypothetical protein